MKALLSRILSPANTPCGRRCIGLSLAAGFLLVAGCASKSGDPNVPLPRKDLAEYRQVVTDALRVVRAANESLDDAVAQTPCPPRTVRAFGKDVQRLEVDSFKMRVRGQAIRNRGAAYFEQWQEHLAQVEDPEARKLAEERRELLQERFAHIRQLSQQARDAFQPFMAGLRQFRSSLEADPHSAAREPMKATNRTTREQGERVARDLAEILQELNTVEGMLKRR